MENMPYKIAVVDDIPDAREMMADTIIDAKKKPIIIDSVSNNINEFINRIRSESEGAIFDQRLKPQNFANFDGAEAVAKLYDFDFPSILVTSITNPDIDEIRPLRRKIPILIANGEPDAGLIIDGFRICVAEFKNHFIPERKPRKALIRIEEIDQDNSLSFIVVPSWDPNLKVRLPLDILTNKINQTLEEGMRLFAEINIGASNHEELYFENIRLAEEPSGEYAKFLHP